MSEITRTYELGYLFVPTLPEAQVEASVQKLTDAIAAISGTVVGSGNPDFIDLAYVMEKSVASKVSKYSQGYFGWIKFDADPEGVEAFKKALDANSDLIRYLLVKTNVQNTVLFKKPKMEARREADIDMDLTESEAPVAAVADAGEDLREDHEKLPDVEGDILDETGIQAAPTEGEAAEEAEV